MKKEERVKNRLLEYFLGGNSMEYMIHVVNADPRLESAVRQVIDKAEAQYNAITQQEEENKQAIDDLVEQASIRLMALRTDYRVPLLLCNRLSKGQKIRLWRSILHYRDEPYRVEREQNGTFKIFIKDLIMEFSEEYNQLISIRLKD